MDNDSAASDRRVDDPHHDDGVGALASRDMAIDRLWTIPNVLTFLRLLAAPVFLYLLFVKDRPGPAGFLLGVLSFTDWIDGWIARRFNQVSNFGKMFDPIVDRIMLVLSIGGILIYGGVPRWLGIVVVVREVAMSLWVLYITYRGVPRLDVTWFGKKGTFFIMLAFPSILISTDTLWPSWVTNLYYWIGWLSVGPGLVFSWIAFGEYIKQGIAGLKALPAADHAV